MRIQQKFIRGLQLWPARVPDSIDEFNRMAALSRRSMLRQTGLHFVGRQYQCEELGTLWNQTPGGTSLSYKVDPLDVSSIQVLHPLTQKYFKAPCVNLPSSGPRTLSFHMAVRGQAVKDGLDPNDPYDMSEAERNLQKAIQEAVAKSKNALKRMTAELSRLSDKLDEVPAPPTELRPVQGNELVRSAMSAAFQDS